MIRFAAAALALAPSFAQVSVREERMAIPSWETGAPQIHTVFADAGGRSGNVNVYPYRLNEILTDRKVDRTYNAIVLENEYIRIVILPEIGGKLFGALDKTNNYPWLYTQKTIKPGLIAMTGAWISGGIEWNFPHGHRSSTFSPVDRRIVRNADGSATVWVGETEWIYRVRWLVGMTVFPGRSYVRCEYIFVNPTAHRQPFQFWATASTHANEYAQAQYPGDVVAGHGKHEFWHWPVHDGVDLTWWKNSPNASSYFAFNNPSDWFGAYDHRARAGMVHVADHRVMPGKKLWTWGSGPSGRIWEDILTEGGGPYFEPQAGAWSDNQPDYHWLEPNEVRRTQDYWYPVRDTRGYHNADRDFAVNTDVQDGKAFAAVYSTAAVSGQRVVLRDAKRNAVLAERTVSISPAAPLAFETPVAPEVTVYDLHLAVYDASGKLRIELRREPPRKVELPQGLRDPGDPKAMTPDELYRAGEWLDRFIRTPEAEKYYQEALRRDPNDARVNAALGYAALKQGRWEEALRRIDIALARDGDNARLHFGRGLALDGMGQSGPAYNAFYRAAWSYGYRAAASLELAKMDLRHGRWTDAIAQTEEAAAYNGRFADIYAYRAAAYRHAGDARNAADAAARAMEFDPMHFMGAYEQYLAGRGAVFAGIMRGEPQNYLELATAYGNAGLFADAEAVLEQAGQHAMVAYVRGYYSELAGDRAAASRHYAEAARMPTAYINPHRLEELAALEAALRVNPSDAHAHLFAGNLLYARSRRDEGFAHWLRAVAIDDKLEPAVRNVAYGYRFLKQDLARSFETYGRALALDPADARVLLEMDQTAEALKRPAAERLALLEKHAATVNMRDDLTARLVALWMRSGEPKNIRSARETLRDRHFHSWEGRYEIHEAWAEANRRLGDMAFDAARYPEALGFYRDSGEYPKNLEVAPRTPEFRAHVEWNIARTLLAAGDRQKARPYLDRILDPGYARTALGVYYQALAKKASGDRQAADRLLARVEESARRSSSGDYLIALVRIERNEPGSREALARLLESRPDAPRIALRQAQAEFGRTAE